MSYTKVSIPKSHEVVLQQLRERIESGKLAPGQRLPSVVDLASQFGVGRSTIREALSALKAMGWLTIQHGGGTYVSKTLPQPGDIHQLFEKAASIQELLQVRKILETGCAALAAKQRTQLDLDKLEEILARMNTQVGDEAASEQSDVDFHLAIAEATHNSLAIQLMASLSTKIQATIKDTRRLWFFSKQATARTLYEEHQQIYIAIREQDEAIATSRMKIHLEKVEHILKDHIHI